MTSQPEQPNDAVFHRYGPEVYARYVHALTAATETLREGVRETFGPDAADRIRVVVDARPIERRPLPEQEEPPR